MIAVLKRYFRRSLVLAIAGLVSACSESPIEELEIYVEDVKAQQTSSIEPLPEFEPYESFIYEANSLRDPFTPPIFSHPQRTATAVGGNGVTPNFGRPTEPLEEFPLDSLRMVGSLEQDTETWALINTTEGAIHRVQPGHYIGQNHGKILRITEFEVELMEIIPDGLGGWVERQASIAISE